MALPNSNIPSQIQPMIMYAVRDHLRTVLVDEVPKDNPTRAIRVMVGRFLENPAKINVSAAISSGDFEDPTMIDGRVDHPDLADRKVRFLPPAEVGGPEYWWRRFSIEVQVFFVRKDYEEDVAIQYAYEFFGRLQKGLEQSPTNGLVDDFGEKSHEKPRIEAVTFFPSGGKGKWIFRGKVLFRLLTERPL